MSLAQTVSFTSENSHTHYIYLKQIFNSIYIDTYRNQLTHFNYNLERILYQLKNKELIDKDIYHYSTDLIHEIKINNLDLEIDLSSLDWLLKTIKRKKYGVLTKLIEETLMENNHFLQISKSINSVLIIDPKLTVLKFLNIVLRQQGIPSLRFSNIEKAIKYITVMNPDISSVICEYNISGFDTYELIAALKSVGYEDTTILFISDYNETAEIRNKFGIGTIDYIKKPIQADIVISKIKALS